MKSHFLYDSRYPKVIYLVRDGRDVCVSYYDFQIKVNGYQKSFDQFVLDLSTDKIWPSPWHTHVISWLGHRNKIPFYLLRYEDLLAEPEDALLSIIQFIGLNSSRHRVKLAIQKASLQKIWGDHQKMGPHRQRGFRGGVSGTSGKWKELFLKDTETTFFRFAKGAMKQCRYV